MTDPYPEPEVIPYTPEDPNLPDPVDAPPPPDREYLTAQEAIDRQIDLDSAAIEAQLSG